MDRVVTAAAAAAAPPAGGQPAAAKKPYPRVREDLVLCEGPRSSAGDKTWRIYDPLRHRFISIDDKSRLALSLWRRHESTDSLARELSRKLRQPFDPADVEAFATFLQRHGLFEETGDGEWRRRWMADKANRPGLLSRAAHNYLFFRVPLFAPARFLEATAPFAAVFFRRQVQWAILAFGLIGLYFVSRQWDVFLSDSRALLTATGLAQFGATLFVVKILHELGHAYAAHRYGCRVPVMGVAFMLMVPMLYTDVTDAWRLPDWRKRFAIDVAGVTVELGLACIATFLWVFLPDGTLRQCAFLLATTSWIMSIAINLNPFMRFDGYYIASDLSGVENLQARAFEIGRWRLREVLFGLGMPPPEPDMSARRLHLLTFYAWGTWVYRLLLFIGIAAAVYHYFFKALGIALFLFEIGFFIAKPVWSELKEWWRMRVAILKSKRTWITVALLALVLAAVIVPWSTNIRAPAVLEAAQTAKIFPTRAAEVVSISARRGQRVQRGDILLRLRSPELESEDRISRARLAAIELRLARTAADKDDLANRQILVSTRVSLISKLAGIERERAELVVRSPVDGIVAELEPTLHPARWVNGRDQLALIRGADSLSIIAYLSEADLWRVERGAAAIFIPDMPLAARVGARLERISSASADHIDQAELAEPNGGTIAVEADPRGTALVPTAAHYQLTLAVDDARGDAPHMRQRGVLHIEGHAESYLAAFWRHVLKVLVRESSA